MNAGVKKLLIFVSDLLAQPQGGVVVYGRRNFEREDFNTLQIVIDNVDTSTRLLSSSKYDGEAEEMQYVQKISSPATIDFYGENAYEECERFVLLLSTQKSYELQRDQRIEVYQESGIIDLKLLTGDQYSERVQISLRIQFNIELTEDVLRIDELQSTLIT